MAKSRKKRSHSKLHGKAVAKPKFAGKHYVCRGKQVRVRKGSKKRVPRVYCSRA